MPIHVRLAVSLVLLTTLGVGVGCGSKGPKTPSPQGRELRKPKEPPPVPPRRDVPLDPALAQAARKELLAAADATEAGVRANALEALREVGGPEAARQVLAGLDDRSGRVRFAAAMTAG